MKIAWKFFFKSLILDLFLSMHTFNIFFCFFALSITGHCTLSFPASLERWCPLPAYLKTHHPILERTKLSGVNAKMTAVEPLKQRRLPARLGASQLALHIIWLWPTGRREPGAWHQPWDSWLGHPLWLLQPREVFCKGVLARQGPPAPPQEHPRITPVLLWGCWDHPPASSGLFAN